jgi:hypothetical protein
MATASETELKELKEFIGSQFKELITEIKNLEAGQTKPL